MPDAIKWDEGGNIAAKLNDCKNKMERGKIYSCLVTL